MKAFRFEQWQKTATLKDVPRPEPGPGEVLIRIGGAGACHSDLHIMHEWTPETFPQVADWPLPFTLGHENAGWIESGDHDGFDVGAPVVISPTWSCGHCPPCRKGWTNYCDTVDLGAGGLGVDGGLAEYMVAPASTLVPLHNLEPAEAAPLTDAGLTSYHAVKRCLPILEPGTTVVVIGVGGLGHLGVAFLRELSGAQIIAVDRDPAALQMASGLGAHVCLPSDDTTVEQVKALTNGLGATVVLDFVGLDATLEIASQIVRKHGQIVLIGIGGGSLPFNFFALPAGCSIVATLGGTTSELAEIVALAEAGRVTPHIHKFPLDEVVSVYEQLEANQIKGRAVLVP
jgi:propanol-preferring alcohol dehydrogenase